MARTVQALLLCCALAQILPAADNEVTLSSTTIPSSGQSGVGYISVTGRGFPGGVIPPNNIEVTLTPPSGSPVRTTALRIKAHTGSVETITFSIPSGVIVTTPTVYAVTVSASDYYRLLFASSNSANLTVNPPAALISIAPTSGYLGSSLSVTITGAYTHFLQGTTVASFGPGISVGGGPSGQPGPVSVTGATTGTAQITISATAAPGVQTVQVTTGVEQESLMNSFTLLPPHQLLSVAPNTLNAGLATTVTLTGANTNFVQGQTQASFGPGIAVGGGAEGQPGPVTVMSATTATAQIAIDAAATAGAQTVTVTTGQETESLESGFSVGTPVGVVNITTTSSLPLAPGFSGAQDEYDLNGVEYWDPKYLAMVQPLKFGSVRFPGGLPSMAFDWQTGHENQAWITELKPYLFPFALNGLNFSLPLLQAKGGANFSDFATFIKTIGATGITDVNGWTDNNPESYGKLVNAAAAANANIVEWEIDNEPYGYPKFFPTGTSYAASAMSPYSTDILAANPNATVGVFYEGQYSGFGDGTSWDTAMNAFSPHFWQAVSTHIYPAGNPSLGTTDKEQTLNGFLAHATNDYFNTYFIPAVGFNTPIYITEWNSDGTSMSPFESYIYNAIVLAEFIARVSTVPNIKEVGVTEIYLGNKFNQSLIRALDDHESYLLAQVQANPNYVTNTATNPNTQFSFYYSTNGLAIMILNQAVNGSNATWPTTVSTYAMPTVPIEGFDGQPVPAVFAQAFQGIDGTHYLIITNKSNVSQPIGIELNGMLGPASVTASYISSTSDTTENTAANQNAVSIVNTTFPNPLTIGPYSVTRLQW